MLLSLDIAVQGVRVVLFQFIVHPAPDHQRPFPLRRVLPAHFPQQKGAELLPETEMQNAVILQHGGIALEPVQHFPGVMAAGHNTGQVQIEGLKGSKLQQKTLNGQIKPPVYGRFKIPEDLLEAFSHQFQGERDSLGHSPGRNHHAQGMADGFLINPADIRIGGRNLPAFQQPAHILPLEEEGF